MDTLLKKYEDIIIYGAGGVAKAIYKLIKNLCPRKKIYIAVTNVKNNPLSIEGCKVYSINALRDIGHRIDSIFIVAMMPLLAETVRMELLVGGYHNVITAKEIADEMYMVLHLHSIQKGKILFTNFSGKGYGCNPKYICEELRRKKIDMIDYVWAVESGRNDFPENVRVIQYGTYEYYYELATAQIWIDNQHKNYLSRKREGQYYIQTWHGGGPLKKIEYDAPNLSRSYLELLEYDMKMVDLCLSNTRFGSEQYRRAFRYEGDILECGYPRNDIFFGDKFDAEDFRKDIGISNKAIIILYAPTIRDRESNLLNISYILEACERLYSSNCIMLIREHPQMTLSSDRYTFSDKVINVSEYSDVQKILAASDMLITDYSSIMWDFSLQKRPVFLYHPDADDYEKERGFYISFSEMPYIEAFDTEDLYRKICSYDDGLYQQRLEEFFRQYEPFDKGDASLAVADRILEVIKDESKR